MARGDRDPTLPHDPLPGGLKHNPFAILRQKGATPTPNPGPEPGEVSRASVTPPSDCAPAPEPERSSADRRARSERPARGARGDPAQRVVVRRERKGRGGKAVTIAEGPGLAGRDLEALAREAARGLGTGARVEDGTLVIQGDQADRLVEWLAKHGFEHCQRGN